MHILKQSEIDGMPCPDTLIHGECLESMKHIADGSVDAIICDLPYGSTKCSWDSVIPFTPLWAAYGRIIKPNGAIVLFGSQPFTSALVMSNLEWFRYEWIWQKTNGGGFFNAKSAPRKVHENIVVFSPAKMAHNCNPRIAYNPQGLVYAPKLMQNSKTFRAVFNGTSPETKSTYIQEYSNYPKSILAVSNDIGIHPTQKPIALMEYLVNTYTNPGDLILDNTMGSATLPVACLNTGRHFIGIEQNDEYFAAGCARVRARQLELASVLPL